MISYQEKEKRMLMQSVNTLQVSSDQNEIGSDSSEGDIQRELGLHSGRCEHSPYIILTSVHGMLLHGSVHT